MEFLNFYQFSSHCFYERTRTVSTFLPVPIGYRKLEIILTKNTTFFTDCSVVIAETHVPSVFDKILPMENLNDIFLDP